MNREYVPEKLTDELERKLIEQELEAGPAHEGRRRSETAALETVVGALLLLGMLLLAARFG